jgi:hypothetical protein
MTYLSCLLGKDKDQAVRRAAMRHSEIANEFTVLNRASTVTASQSIART